MQSPPGLDAFLNIQDKVNNLEEFPGIPGLESNCFYTSELESKCAMGGVDMLEVRLSEPSRSRHFDKFRAGGLGPGVMACPVCKSESYKPKDLAAVENTAWNGLAGLRLASRRHCARNAPNSKARVFASSARISCTQGASGIRSSSRQRHPGGSRPSAGRVQRINRSWRSPFAACLRSDAAWL